MPTGSKPCQTGWSATEGMPGGQGRTGEWPLGGPQKRLFRRGAVTMVTAAQD